MSEYKESLTKAIKEYLLECMGSNEKESLNEIRRYRKEFKDQRGYNLYAYGNICPYYSQMREFMIKNGVNPSEDNEVMQLVFEKYIQFAVDELLEEKKNG